MHLSPHVQNALQRLDLGDCVRSSEALGGPWSARQPLLLHYEDHSVVLKPARPSAAGLVQAKHEFEAMQWAHGRGLAPKPLSFDPHTGWLAHMYVCGETPWEHCEAMAKHLQELHKQPHPAWPRFDPLQVAGASLSALRAAGAVSASQQQWLERRLAGARAQLKALEPVPLAACHNDLQPFNVVRGAQTLFIDWEDAALGDPLWDMASWITSLALPPERHAALLEAPTQANLHRLALWCTVAEVYFMAWGLLRPAWRALEARRLAQFML